MPFDPSQINTGSAIYTRDGEKIGTVKLVRDDYIRVDASMQVDYWLPLGSVGNCTPERVTMSFSKDELGAHKTDLPGDEETPRSVRGQGFSALTGPNTQSELYSTDDRELPPSEPRPGD